MIHASHPRALGPDNSGETAPFRVESGWFAGAAEGPGTERSAEKPLNGAAGVIDGELSSRLAENAEGPGGE